MKTYTMRIKRFKVNGQQRAEITIYQDGQWMFKYAAGDPAKNLEYANKLVTALRARAAKSFPF